VHLMCTEHQRIESPQESPDFPREGRPMRKEMDPNSLLILWIKIHGRVAPKFHSVFRDRPEIQELVYYKRETLEQAFASSPKLKEILEKARELEPDVKGELDSPSSPRANPEQILPLPGDAGGTRRPGKKREPYRTGEEAELRHIAKEYRWW
jgi:hypothetical protein